ncbi:hypothetical protein CPB84DRAFT_1264640 [Gymnopilus junonius]|uniref:Uncharacterized protein n=1 Tax=Gymnopilus junonius TaxID=109634 RepID=A0A9P5N8W9_GYMJU|nr:hypothetical protein CPB84DRAFT_1264640 [Gymnopilus junonius]
MRRARTMQVNIRFETLALWTSPYFRGDTVFNTSIGYHSPDVHQCYTHGQRHTPFFRCSAVTLMIRRHIKICQRCSCKMQRRSRSNLREHFEKVFNLKGICSFSLGMFFFRLCSLNFIFLRFCSCSFVTPCVRIARLSTGRSGKEAMLVAESVCLFVDRPFAKRVTNCGSSSY